MPSYEGTVGGYIWPIVRSPGVSWLLPSCSASFHLDEPLELGRLYFLPRPGNITQSISYHMTMHAWVLKLLSCIPEFISVCLGYWFPVRPFSSHLLKQCLPTVRLVLSCNSYCALNSGPQPLVFVKNLERNDGHSEKCWESQASSVTPGGQCINLIWQTHSRSREESAV